MAIREEVYYAPGSEVFIFYIDDAGEEHRLPVPHGREARTATLRLLRASGKSAYAAREWGNNPSSRVGVDFED